MERAPVPKFGSFKPKASAKTTEAKARVSEENTKPDRREHSGDRESRDRGQKRHSRNHGHRHRHRSKDGERHRRGSRETERVTEPVIAPDKFEESNLYIVDRRGDPKNVEYGSLHRYSIPVYRRSGYGNIIGLPTSAKIDREESNDREVSIMQVLASRHKRAPRLLTARHGRASERLVRVVMPTSADVPGPEDPDSDYIALRPSRKRKRSSESPNASENATSLVDYRSIEGKAKVPDQPADEDLAVASDSSADQFDEDLGLRLRQENAVFSRTAKARPTDLDSWLALADHQGNLVRPGTDVSSLSSAERRTVADLRHSILTEASKHITKNKAGRESLLLAIIEEGTIIWDSKKLTSQWREALAECASSPLIWTKYLDFIQYNGFSFRFEKSRDAYLQCLLLLRNAWEQSPDVEKSSICQIQISVLLRMTKFFRDSGYDELATAIWQATLEFQLFMPSRLQNASIEEQLTTFEDFWESEAPRIGEERAEGWNRYDESGSGERRCPATYDAPTVDPSHQLGSFVDQEIKLHGFSLPATMDDDGATLDPYRCVMFSDIKDVVRTLIKTLPKMPLLEAFLAFFELPSLPAEHSNNNQIENIFSGTTTIVSALLSGQQLTPDAMLIPSRRESIDTLMGGSTFHLGNQPELARYVDRTLDLLVTTQFSDALAEFYLGFKYSVFPTEAKKTAKRLLKANSSSLRLYNAYALLEFQDNTAKAQDVWSTAMSMRSKLDASAEFDVIYLWHSRLLSACQKGDLLSARKELTSLNGPPLSEAAVAETTINDGETGARLLKVKRDLEEGLDRMLFMHKAPHAAMFADCLAWLAYLSQSHETPNLSAALQTYSKHASRMSKENSCLTPELLLQYKAAMVNCHMAQKRPYKPATLKQDLEDGLKLLPNNSILLEVHSQLAAQDRLRTLVQEQQAIDTSKLTEVQWSHRIAQELRRFYTAAPGSTSNSVRSAFRTALLGTDSQVGHSSFLWLAWLRFEHQVATSNRNQGCLKQVFLDGLRNLPWHKGWGIVGMKYLSDCDGLSKVELKQVHEAMVERGLRMRIDIEDVI